MSTDSLTGKAILRLYYPLALSWVFMVLDGPVSVGVISLLPDARINTAAFLILMSLSLWIESPVIDLLSTSTTLGKDRTALHSINRFAYYLIGWVACAHALVALTPLYYGITEQVLRVEPAVARACRPGFILMIPWSALIGWRRSRQGLMIRNGETRLISAGTFLRLVVLLTVDFGLAQFSHLSGLGVAAAGLLASVGSEALFVHFASRDVVNKIASTQAKDGADLSMRRLATFHFPLTATTMMKLMTGPVIAAGLARTFEPTRSLAAYEVASTVLFVFRAIAFCLPEVVISLYRDDASRPTLRRFSLVIGGISSGISVLLSLCRGDVYIFTHFLHTSSELAEIGHWMFLASSFAPILDASMSYVLGVLTAHHLTMARMFAVVCSSLIMCAAVAIAVVMRWSGPVLAGFSISTGLFSELAILAVAWLRAKPTLAPHTA